MGKMLALTVGIWIACVTVGSVHAAEERQSANGVAIPEKSAVLTFNVWCYAAGHQALSGQPGVIDVVMSVRNQPFGEWDVVYYDPAKTTPEIFLKRLRANGCERATRLEKPAEEKNGITAQLENPLIAPGDLIQVSLKAPDAKNATVSVSVPRGWRVIGGDKITLKTGVNLIEIQSGKIDAPGNRQMAFFVNIDGKETAFNASVDVVHLVR